MSDEKIVEHMIEFIEEAERNAIADEKLKSKVVDKILAELEREFKNENKEN